MVTDERVRKGVLRLHSEGMSLVDIAQKMNIKKHTVEGIVKGVQESTETLSDTPQRVFEIPKQPPYMQGGKTVKEGNLELELLLLQEKNKSKELELKAKELELKIAETEYKKAESKELTEREKLKHLGVVELKKIELENKRLADEKKARQRAEQADVTQNTDAAYEVGREKLERQIDKFLGQFVEHEPDISIDCDQEQADAYHKKATLLLKKVVKFFEGEFVDCEQLTHYQALTYIAEMFEGDFSKGGFFGKNNAYYAISEEENALLNACIAGYLGDEAGEEIDQDEEDDIEEED